jgi:hypothetical protein
MRKCPACDGEVEAEWIACPHCGVKFEGEAAVADPEYGTLERVVETVLDKREAKRTLVPVNIDSAGVVPFPAKKHWTEVLSGE